MTQTSIDDSIFIIWSSPNPEVAENIAFMYAHNSLRNGWWGRVRLIIWGPSANLVATDTAIQNRLKTMADDGVEIVACKACSDNYGVTDTLTALGLEVKHVGKDVTDMIKSGWRQLSF